MHRVTIIQRIVPHYRVSFFVRLAERLAADDIEFRLIYGQEYPGTVPASLAVDKSWAVRIENKYIVLANKHLVWQAAWNHAKSSDLVIVEQASSLLLNYWLLCHKQFGQMQLAYWGHGINRQTQATGSISERLKGLLLTKVDWWFAYSKCTHDLLRKARFPEHRITVVQNAVDNESFEDAIKALSLEELAALRNCLGITGSKVGMYCGALTKAKRIDMVIKVCVAIRSRIPDFEAIIIGSGPDVGLVEAAAAANPWFHFVGPKFGAERAQYFKISDVLIQPGVIGLVIVDSFVSEVPLFTTELSTHGPEIAFLENGYNGCVTPNSIDAYVDAVCRFLNSPVLQQAFIEGCRVSARKYSMEAMVNNMASGINACLMGQRGSA